jgi:hypothetical protein
MMMASGWDQAAGRPLAEMPFHLVGHWPNSFNQKDQRE